MKLYVNMEGGSTVGEAQCTCSARFPTVPSTVEGGAWVEVVDGEAILKILLGGQSYVLSGGTNDTTPSGPQTYYFMSGGENYVRHVSEGDLVVLEAGLTLSDMSFSQRNQYKDLILSYGGTSATISSTLPSAVESLSTNGRTVPFIEANGGRYNVTFYEDGRAVSSDTKSIVIGHDYAETAFDATNFTLVSSAHSPILIQGGQSASSLKGGANSDTLVGNSGNDTFVGGSGSDLFVVNISGENIIEDFDAVNDQISLTSGDMSNLKTMTAGAAGLQLGFDDGEIFLADVMPTTSVTIDNTAYVVQSDRILTADFTQVTLFAPVTLNANTYPNANVFEAKNGGSIKAGSLNTTLAGANAILDGGTGSDTFIFTGGNVTLKNFDASADRVSLKSGYTLDLFLFDATTSKVTLTIKDDADKTGDIIFDTLANGSIVELWQTNSNGVPTSMAGEFTKAVQYDNSNDITSANSSTVYAAYADFGVFDATINGYTPDQRAILSNAAKETTPGTEYFKNMYYITAARNNSTITGNAQNNIFIIKGGAHNVLTGGLGIDTFIFNSGGGVITDWGAGATKTGAKEILAGVPTQGDPPKDNYISYNRTDPSTYKQGNDVLKVYGEILEVAYDREGSTSEDYASSTNCFCAYVTYDADFDGVADYVIKLDNIHKQPTTYGDDPVYRANNYVVHRFSIWDTSADENHSTLALRSGDIDNLIKDITESQYKDKINELEAWIATW